MSDTVILVEIDVTPAAGGAVQTLRFSDRAIRPMPPTDPDRPNTVWSPRLNDVPSIRRALVDDMASLAAGWGVGTLSLLNADQALTTHRLDTWGEIRVYRWTEGTPFAAAHQLFSGRAALPTFDRSARAANRIEASFADPRVELDAPLQVNLYAGTGGLAGGAELKDRPKPLAYGDLTTAQIPAPKVNVATGVYQLHDGAIDAVTGVFDRGDNAGLISDGNKVGAAFDAWAPAGAHYATDIGRGLVKINNNPIGATTFGLRGESGPYVDTAGPIMARLLARLGVPAGRIGASVAALPAAAPVGVFDQSGVQGRDVLGQLARSALAALLPGRDGVWQAVRLAPPKAIPNFTVLEQDVIDLAEDLAPLPAGVIRVGYDRVWSTFSGAEIAPALLGTAAAVRLEAEYRYAVLEDATAKARGPGAWRTLQIDTALRAQADAEALAASLKALFGLPADGEPRRQWSLVVEATDAVMAVPLGATVRVIYPPLGLDKRLLLLGEQPLKPRRDQTTWTLWG
ncbi:hypothetical protein [Caulobacter segnis]|uniref:Tip attachment protein J domain-containing protein n=1 Tax=Caulobacter segnis TaxID=88688 RepID=A0A2W5V0P2_9CAUL|nr:hypothetical protein [Caulobacter segnis]PZR32297.1 MAG: hypothetical protein DI526_17130 [Caulobacter segnis]